MPEEKFWVSCYKTGEESVHGKVHMALNERNRDLLEYEGQGGVVFHGNEAEVGISLLLVVST